MEEKKVTKISLSTFFLILAIIVIIIMSVFIYKLYNDKTAEVNKSNELQSQVNNLNSTINNLQGKIDSISNTSISSESNTSNSSNKNEKTSKKLSDSEKKELFNKAIKEQLVLIDDMISEKDFSQKNFTDKEIILMLPDSSEGQIFSTYNDNSGFYKKASIENVEKSAKKLFNKTIDINSIQNGNSIRVINNDVIVEVRSGVGVLNAELISINSINDYENIIEFKFTSGSDTAEIYKLTVNYNQGNVIYENFEK